MGSPVPFRSILFADSDTPPNLDEREAPDIFKDLNLDQVVLSLTAGREEYNLGPFFYTPLLDVKTVNYRQEIFRDLEIEDVALGLQSFARDMKKMRSNLAQAGKLYYQRQKQRWFLDAVMVYAYAARQLNHHLLHTTIGSQGLSGFRSYLASYIESNEFRTLADEGEKLKNALSDIRYSLAISGQRVTVSECYSEVDYSVDVLRTFEKFRQGTAKAYKFEYHSTVDMNHVEAAILDFVAKLHPETFAALEEYGRRHAAYLDRTIAKFDREIQFYLACLKYISKLRKAELPFCYPEVTDRSREVYGKNVFDLALAAIRVHERSSIVLNDFYLRDPERVLVVSGPNQGGKTTFARTFGQLHYLASIGCPVPAAQARLFLSDRIFTHFDREEDIRNLSGKLEDELNRIHHILEAATSDSILIMNESFLATTLNDALFLSKEVMRRISALGMLCVSVTFLDELASLNETTVSMVSTVNPGDPASRTFKLVRRPADGLAYAVAIAKKHRLTYEAVRARVIANAKRQVTK
ncbi:MAG TPA: hypothetical protein VMB49_02285 [Acidobacteriaceae bacterium]|nr:hypothetical protein [Acidobacteriaceae bacterium]